MILYELAYGGNLDSVRSQERPERFDDLADDSSLALWFFETHLQQHRGSASLGLA